MEHKKGKDNQSEQQEKRISLQKNEDSINSLWDNFKTSNIHITGMPEGEEKEQEIANLSEKIVKENITNLAKEIDMRVQES